MARSLKAYTDDYMKLAEAGENVAQMQLGLLFSTGQKGAPLDYITAHKLVELGRAAGQ